MINFGEEEAQNDSISPENRKKGLPVEHDSCIICLQRIQDRTILPQCSHDSQCFSCILEWTKHSTKCPLCVSEIGPFLIHKVRSKHDYKRHFISPNLSPNALAQSRSLAAGRRWPNSAVSGPSNGHLHQRQEEQRRYGVEAALLRRRRVYNNGLFAKHVAANRYTGYAPHLTPAQVSASVELQGRARAFLRRELRVWINLDVEFLTNYIILLIKTLDLRSEAGIKLLADLMDPSIPYSEDVRKPNTEHMAHELLSFLRSPFKQVEAYDAAVQAGSHIRIDGAWPNTLQYDESSSSGQVHHQSNQLARNRSLSPSLVVAGRDDRHVRHRSNHERKHSRTKRGGEENQRSSVPHPLSSSRSSSRSRIQGSSTTKQSGTQVLDEERKDSNHPEALASLATETSQNSANTITVDTSNHQAALMRKIRIEMNLQCKADMTMDGDSQPRIYPPASVLPGVATTVPSMGQLTTARREELLSRLQDEKARLGRTQIPEADEPDDVAGVSPIHGAEGLQIRGAAAKARESLEKKLRAQAHLRVRLAREKARVVETRGEIADEATSATMDQVENAGGGDGLLDPSEAKADLQHRLREKLLKERLMLTRTKKLDTAAS